MIIAEKSQDLMEKSFHLAAESIDDIDKISLLPDDILHRILSRLKIFEAVETSILSSKWKCVWNTMPYLDFNFLDFLNERPGLVFDYFLAEKFKDFVNWVLISQGSSKIIKFRLRCSNVFNKDVILRWIYAVSRRNVQELDLSFNPSMAFELPHCLLASESLRALRLNLFGHVVELRGGARFSNLRSLHLVCVELVDEDLTRGLFSGCPLLEDLSLLYCVVRNMDVLDITSASLKRLTIDCHGDIDGEGNGYCGIEVKISCPNLVQFDYAAPVARSYFLENLFSLEMVCIFLMLGYQNEPSDKEVGRLMCEVLKNFPNTTELKLNLGVVRCISNVLDRLICLDITFHRLKSLTVLLATNEQLMRAVIFLLKYSPNLEALTLVSEETEEWSAKWELQDDNLTCLKASLKTVQLIEFRGDENELKLVRFLLKHGLVLEKMTIFLTKPVEESTTIVDTILGFPKSSHLAAVIIDSTTRYESSADSTVR